MTASRRAAERWSSARPASSAEVMGRALNLLEVALDGSFDYALCEVQVALAAMRDPEEVRRVASALVMMSARQMPPVRGRQVLVRRWLALVRAELARRVAGEGS